MVGVWDSPKLVTANRVPKVLPLMGMDYSMSGPGSAGRRDGRGHAPGRGGGGAKAGGGLRSPHPRGPGGGGGWGGIIGGGAGGGGAGGRAGATPASAAGVAQCQSVSSVSSTSVTWLESSPPLPCATASCAFFTWRSPAWPLSCCLASTMVNSPYMPGGVHDSPPPLVLTGSAPPGAMRPLSTNAPASPLLQKPRSSRNSSVLIVKAS